MITTFEKCNRSFIKGFPPFICQKNLKINPQFTYYFVLADMQKMGSKINRIVQYSQFNSRSPIRAMVHRVNTRILLHLRFIESSYDSNSESYNFDNYEFYMYISILLWYKFSYYLQLQVSLMKPCDHQLIIEHKLQYGFKLKFYHFTTYLYNVGA